MNASRLQILEVVSSDANNRNVPLAYVIAANENSSNYEWLLKLAMGEEGTPLYNFMRSEDMVVISDRHKGLGSSISKMLPGAHAM